MGQENGSFRAMEYRVFSGVERDVANDIIPRLRRESKVGGDVFERTINYLEALIEEVKMLREHLGQS